MILFKNESIMLSDSTTLEGYDYERDNKHDPELLNWQRLPELEGRYCTRCGSGFFRPVHSDQEFCYHCVMELRYYYATQH